ncbi:hypothetical protein N1851_015432 [Merluccius polli]|uniref:Uncharacterized protein n=1 Tax=Merluccius polli TaxID=89951 RepID=A0AA47P0C5_MERPO|nr:hypothetical protein N1851_015432 [Merluccius polli]
MGSSLRREAPCTSWVSCWVTVAVPARRLDTSQSTTGSTVKKESTYINTQIVFDATFNILDAVAKWPGSTRDPRIVMGCGLRREAPCTSWVSCWVTAAIPARRLDTSQSTTGSS